MKDINNYVEVLVFSKELAAQLTQAEIVERFRTMIQPAIDLQEANAKKMAGGSLRNVPPIHLS
ncbi:MULTISPECIES: hypothetical protein [Longitalea]|uniref:hypothetical protein n=1 Tax=Longitalea TaxID=2967331 RepID=UPI00196838F6|nr:MULTISPECIES: hypothetical protein [Longitalea]